MWSSSVSRATVLPSTALAPVRAPESPTCKHRENLFQKIWAVYQHNRCERVMCLYLMHGITFEWVTFKYHNSKLDPWDYGTVETFGWKESTHNVCWFQYQNQTEDKGGQTSNSSSVYRLVAYKYSSYQVNISMSDGFCRKDRNCGGNTELKHGHDQQQPLHSIRHSLTK